MLQKALALTERALRIDSRGRVSHVIRVIVALIIIVGLLPISLLTASNAPGLQMFSAIVLGDALLVCLVTPVYFASCISDEKEERTLSLLLLADVSPLSLISGKVFPQLLAIGLILLVQLPFTMLAITLGGVQIHQLLAAFLALASGVWLLAGVSTLCSVLCRQSSSAIGWAFGFEFLYVVLGFFASILGAVAGRVPAIAWLAQPSADLGSVLIKCSLWGRLAVIGESTFSEGPEMLASSQFLFSVITGTTCLLAAWLLFEPMNRDLDAEVVQQRARRLIGQSRRVWNWPVVWKEYFFVCGGHLEAIFKCVIYGMLVIGFPAIGLYSGNSAYWSVLMAGYLVFWIMTLEIQFRLASSFAFEAKDQTWSALLSLPHSVHTLVWSKVTGLLFNMWPGFAALLLCGLIGVVGADYGQMRFPGNGGNKSELILGLLAVPFFSLIALMYMFNYLQLTVLYATYIKNRWLAIVASFGTAYALNCVLYCLLMVPFLLVFEADMPILISIGVGGLYIILGAGLTYLMYRQVISTIAAQVD